MKYIEVKTDGYGYTGGYYRLNGNVDGDLFGGKSNTSFVVCAIKQAEGYRLVTPEEKVENVRNGDVKTLGLNGMAYEATGNDWFDSGIFIVPTDYSFPKPEQWREWTVDEVPLGAKVRTMGSGRRRLITVADPKGDVTLSDGSVISFGRLIKTCEYLAPDGEWKRCGVKI
jgi:hypothetical protein